jgi:thioredoxin 1
MSKVLNINSDQFENEVIKSSVPVLVDFWAPWCAPCRAMAPILDELSMDLDGKVKVIKVDVDEPVNQELAMTYQIRSIPSMKIFKNGNVVQEFVGMRSKSELAHEIDMLS